MTYLFECLDQRFLDIKNLDIAVGVSGGADSMALVHVLSQWCGGQVHVLIVDHGLREDSADEAVGVKARLKGMHVDVLKWDATPDRSRVQERAREARYRLMADYMAEQGLKHLFLAHHMDDQAETFLFRLAKGSGLDGLACMSERQKQGEMLLCRPFLNARKTDLLAYCEEYGLEFVTDPSNDSDAFARVRLRKSMDVLSREGLSVERLGVASARFARARAALEVLAGKAYEACVSQIISDRIVFNFVALSEQPHEIVVRCVLKAIQNLSAHAVRLQRVEALCDDLIHEADFRKRTLSGLTFERKNDMFIITCL